VQSSKLVNLLKAFDAVEWKKFERFVKSEYFNRRPKLIELLALLKKASPNWHPKKLQKKVVYKKLFLKDAYAEQKIVELMNALVKLIEQFWLIEKNIDPAEKYRNQALVYQQRGFSNYRDVWFNKSLKALQPQLMEAETYHNHYFKHQLEIHLQVESEGFRNQEPNLQALNDHLDTYYICAKLKYYCKVLNYQNFRSYNYNIKMIDAVLKEAEQPHYSKIPSIQIYYHGVFTMLSLDNEENFFSLKKLLKENTSNFSIGELQNIFVLARNFCVKNLNRGKREYVKEALALYKIEIASNIIFEDGKIVDGDCRNIIKLALLANEIDWALQFLKRYKVEISTEVYTLSLGNLYFEQKKYIDVLALLLPVSFEEVILSLALRGLILKTYFQLCRSANNFDYDEKLEAYIDSFKMFLKRKKESLTRTYLLYLNLVKFTQIINKLYWKPEFDQKKMEAIHQQILENPKTAEWDWLKEISATK